jgi:hypothetical protein
MSKIFLVVPDAPPEEVAHVKASRTLGDRGIRLGVLDNSKGNADHLLRFIVEGVKAVMPVASVVMTRKGSVSLPAPADVLDQLTREADFVVSAMAD